MKLNLLFVGAILFCLLTAYLNNKGSLNPVSEGLPYIIIKQVIISGLILYFAWFFKTRPPRIEQIAVTIYALLPLASLLIKSDRVFMLLELALLYFLLAIIIVHFVSDKKYITVTWMVTVLHSMSIVCANNYSYVNNVGGIHFWKLPLFMSLAVTAVFAFAVNRGIVWLKENKISERICLIILIFAGSFILTSDTLSHLNYALDSSEPVNNKVEILEKEIDSDPKKATEYILTVKIDSEEVELNVSQLLYFEKEAGDTVCVRLYDGALGQPYYVGIE